MDKEIIGNLVKIVGAIIIVSAAFMIWKPLGWIFVGLWLISAGRQIPKAF